MRYCIVKGPLLHYAPNYSPVNGSLKPKPTASFRILVPHLALFILMTGCNTSNYEPKDSETWRGTLSVTDMDGADQAPHDKFIIIVSNYVDSLHEWKLGDYRINLHQVNGDVRIYWVIFSHERPKDSAGGYGDFEVHLNSRTEEIIKILHFQ